MVQKTIHSIDEFPGTLEDKDSLNRDLLPNVLAYLTKMFDRKMIYGYSPNASNFAIDSNKTGRYDHVGNYIHGKPALKELVGGCHGMFNINHSPATTLFVNWFYRSRHKEDCRVFYDWILDPKESPWRDALQNTTVLRDPENDIPVCIVFRDLANEDIHLATNFLIASRLNTEFNSAELFTKLISFGFTRPEAYALCPNFYIYARFNISDPKYQTVSIFDKTPWGKNPYSEPYEESYEQLPAYNITYGPFQTSDRPFYANFDSKQLISRSPSVQAKTPYLKAGSAPNPCNYIWAGTEAAEDRITGQLFEPPKQEMVCSVTGNYSGKDIFGFWKYEPTKPSREQIAHIKKLLNTPKSERKERISLSV